MVSRHLAGLYESPESFLEPRITRVLLYGLSCVCICEQHYHSWLICIIKAYVFGMRYSVPLDIRYDDHFQPNCVFLLLVFISGLLVLSSPSTSPSPASSPYSPSQKTSIYTYQINISGCAMKSVTFSSIDRASNTNAGNVTADKSIPDFSDDASCTTIDVRREDWAGSISSSIPLFLRVGGVVGWGGLVGWVGVVEWVGVVAGVGLLLELEGWRVEWNEGREMKVWEIRWGRWGEEQ